MALRVEEHERFKNCAVVEQTVSARLQGPEEDNNFVRQFMMHGCTVKCLDAHGACRKGYLKFLNAHTVVDDRGYCMYARPGEEDRRVVPHNMALLKRFHAHLNVEIAATVNVIMYLYKCLYKGPEIVRYNVQAGGDVNDEIECYKRARYISATDAAWRIMGFHVNHRDPAVRTLPVHLPGQDFVVFDEADAAAAVTATTGRAVSPLDKYLCRPADFRDMSYVDFHEKVVEPAPRARPGPDDYVYLVKNAEIRIRRRKLRSMICRMNIVQPSMGEVYYLRLLLLHTCPTSFDDSRTVDGQLYDTFHEACVQRNLLEEENEHELCFAEAVDSSMYSPHQLRSLLVVLIMDGAPATTLLNNGSTP